MVLSDSDVALLMRWKATWQRPIDLQRGADLSVLVHFPPSIHMSVFGGKRKISPVRRVSSVLQEGSDSPSKQLRLQIPSMTGMDKDFIVVSGNSSSVDLAVTPVETTEYSLNKSLNASRNDRSPSLQSSEGPFTISHDEHNGGHATRRPSTATSVIRRLHIEKQADSGGITISGIFVWANCYVIMLVMGTFFFIVGTVLTVVSYAHHEDDDDDDDDADSDGENDSNRNSEYYGEATWSRKGRIIGPIFILIGVTMAFFGLTLWFIGWKLTKVEREHEYLHRKQLTSAMGARRLSSQFFRDQLSEPKEVCTPAISQALPIGLLATPGIPIVVNFPLWSAGRLNSYLIQNPVTQMPYKNLDAAQLIEHTSGAGAGGAPSSSLPSNRVGSGSGMQTVGSNIRKASLPAFDSRRNSRRGSTRHACAINEAKQELRLLASTVEEHVHANDASNDHITKGAQKRLPLIHVTESSPSPYNISKRVKFDLQSETDLLESDIEQADEVETDANKQLEQQIVEDENNYPGQS